ncbi:hypothetical protein ES319_D01G052700v1 [Gossypium barbadense]|uniref:Secreted protein n=1 Tax=Gossypium barbadense TaxID=3634 RepID=A0A5J5SKJ6_GOSBA|nr:hypothetical protein ES319_D01G052700v1 [Gossypium barbadense]
MFIAPFFVLFFCLFAGAAKGMVVVDGMGVCDGVGGRHHGRVGVVLVADSMGEWEEASGSLGFWDWAWMLG